MITPAGPLPHLRFQTPVELIHCALASEFVSDVSRELDRPPHEACFRAAIQDKAMQRILGMLVDELESHQPLGRLYVDSLAHALATRFLLLDMPIDQPSARAPALLPRVLRRVREKIEANLEADLSLESLAEETGYSRAHFLRMFRAATGLTPHQYVMELRLARAQECLRHAGSSIVDVAVSCGFASQSHMTSVFRRRLEITPGAFRRSN
jgi:AraC family transcriptional regulator